MTPFQKHPFADVLQSRCSWISQVFVIYTIFTNIQVFLIYTKCFPLKILQFLWTAFFIEHLWWLPLPFTSSFRSYYWEDLLVIWFTLTHPSLWLNAGLKLITKKNSRQICLKLTIKISKTNCKNKSITINKDMFIAYQKNTWQRVRQLTSC